MEKKSSGTRYFKKPAEINRRSERSEQCLVTECFFNLFLEVSHKLEQLEFKLEKIIGIQKHAGQVRKRTIWALEYTFVSQKLAKAHTIGRV